jgi:trans-aconitate 2-methyltransferase
MSDDAAATGPLAGGRIRTGDWDAATYHAVSAPQQQWAREQLSRLTLRGDEVVLDAGCGSGKVTAMLAELIPGGRLYAVDAAPSMVAHTQTLLGARVTALCQDLAELSLPEPVDAVFSNATFHWVPDHPKLFAALAANMKPGAQLVAQCGGTGNIDRLRRLADEVAAEPPFAPYFEDWQGPWNYASAEITEQRLEQAGFTDVRCWLEERPTLIEQPETFLRTICLMRQLQVLPENLGKHFVAAVIERSGVPLRLDYVRLNIVARRGPGAVAATASSV